MTSRAISDLLTDEAILRELGERLAGVRVRAGLSQAQLAREAGISKRTVERLESGASTQSRSLVRVLRVLGLVVGLEELAPRPTASPMELLKRRGSVRKRASAKKSPEGGPWSWDDEQ